MKKIPKILFLLLAVFALVILFLLNPLVYLPHKHISISLPFASSVDNRTTLIPMGEKIEHNEKNGNPNGHEGIDFGWGAKTEILASHDGLITGIVNSSEGINITISTFFYQTVYKELTDVPTNIKLFRSVKQGAILGYPRMSTIEGNIHGQVHWEFSSSSKIFDRLCPVNYFDIESKRRVEAIWKAMPDNDRFKQDYPEICNGAFVGKER